MTKMKFGAAAKTAVFLVVLIAIDSNADGE